jgi:hypothetical protein
MTTDRSKTHPKLPRSSGAPNLALPATCEASGSQLDSYSAQRLAEVPGRHQPLAHRCFNGTASPRQAIKCMCFACLGWEGTPGKRSLAAEVKACTSRACPLWRYRPGAQKP